MNNFITASKQKLRFSTNVGLLSVEQLWDLKSTQLIDLEDNLKEIVEKGESKLSRRKRVVKTTEQSQNELRLSIITEILDIKEAEEDAAIKLKDLKKDEQELLSLLSDIEKKEKASMTKEQILERLETLRK